jgi:hypothetical protein
MAKQLFRRSSASTHLPTPANEHWNPPRGVRSRETETQETQQTNKQTKTKEATTGEAESV